MDEIRVIRGSRIGDRMNPVPDAAFKATERQHLGYFLGVSGDTCGSTGLAMHLVIVPPGEAADPHFHDGYETAIYQLEGLVETRYGEKLEHSVVTKAGDFLFVPPGVPHQAVNLSKTEPAVAIIARNDANEQERVVPYTP
jgi:uncharacterized RmlC-like cupin family protein